MNILVLTPWYPSEQTPIQGVFVREHAKAANLFDNVVIMHLMGADPFMQDLWRMEQEYNLDLTDGLTTYRLYIKKLFPHTSIILQCWACYKAILILIKGGFRPDVLHAHIYTAGITAIIIGKLFGVPVVLTEHSTAFLRHTLSRKEITIAKWVMRRVHKVMPVSLSLQHAIKRLGIQANYHIVPNAVNTDLFHPKENKEASATIKRLLFVGLLDLSHKKGLPYLFKALADVNSLRKDWELAIVGSGAAQPQYERLINELEIADKVIFLGTKSKVEIAKIMRESSLFILPSLFETFSVVTIEAMASGLPVLVTSCGGPEEYVNESAGKVVLSRDAAALSESLQEMLDHLDKYDPFWIHNYTKTKFGPDKVGMMLHNIYMSIKHDVGK